MFHNLIKFFQNNQYYSNINRDDDILILLLLISKNNWMAPSLFAISVMYLLCHFKQMALKPFNCGIWLTNYQIN